MSNARVLDDAPWLKSGPTARVLGLLNGNGEEARVVGGAPEKRASKIKLSTTSSNEPSISLAMICTGHDD